METLKYRFTPLISEFHLQDRHSSFSLNFFRVDGSQSIVLTLGKVAKVVMRSYSNGYHLKVLEFKKGQEILELCKNSSYIDIEQSPVKSSDPICLFDKKSKILHLPRGSYMLRMNKNTQKLVIGGSYIVKIKSGEIVVHHKDRPIIDWTKRSFTKCIRIILHTREDDGTYYIKPNSDDAISNIH